MMARVSMVVALTALSVIFPSPSIARDVTSAERSIEETWSALDAAWNARDVETFAGLFAEDASFLIVTREPLLEGRAAIRARYAGQFSSQSPELRHVSEVQRVQHLGRGLAAVDIAVRVWRTGGPDGGEPKVLRSFAVFAVMTKVADAWEIRAVRVHPLPEPA